MDKIIEKLLETRVIYDKKLDESNDAIKEMNFKDKNFDKILNRVSSLISLMLQEENFIEEYKARKENKEMEEK